MVEHKHCKICNKVIEKPDSYLVSLAFVSNPFYKLGVCKICVIKEGLKRFNKKNKQEKPKDMNYGKNE